MKRFVKTFAAAAVTLAAASPAFAELATNAGLSPAEAHGLTLTELAQVKFNNDTRGDDRQAINVMPGSRGNTSQIAASAGLSPAEAQTYSLNQIFVAKINAEGRGNEQQWQKGGLVSMASRSAGGARSVDAQFAASAGLSPAEAAGMSLSELAAAKFARDTATGDR